ncbi:uncharacterized protein LOC133930107 [Phragmites australis]|uniref:uncharacterized protein LOC133930107 n=1 Tax=Phragmites australis TaxID=29695 RepID=UPI002D7798DE|nr:uncharacterized protein LOC133930107 [Phragmites australis]
MVLHLEEHTGAFLNVLSPGENGIDAPPEETVSGRDEFRLIRDTKCTISCGGNANFHDEIGSNDNEKLDLPISGDGTEAENAGLGSNRVENHDIVPSGLADALGANEEELPPKKSIFSYTDVVKERFNKIFKYYVGTHNLHNFTTRIKVEGPAANRFIISFGADRVVSLNRIDFVRCEVVSQSFMLHKIWKMIGLAVAVIKGVTLNLDNFEEFKVKYIFTCIAAMEHREEAVALWLH